MSLFENFSAGLVVLTILCACASDAARADDGQAGIPSAPTQPAASAVRIDAADVLHAVPAIRGVMTEGVFGSVYDAGNPPQPRGVDRGYGRLFDLQEEDFARAAAIGIRTIRCSVGHLTLENRNQPGKYREEGFRLLRRTLDLYAKYNIQAIIDLHNAIGREGGGDPRLWQNKEFQDRFVAVWREIARRFRDHPQVIAYEPLNEPEPRHTKDWEERYAVWNKLAARVTEAIRRIDADKPIIIDCIEYAHPSAFRGLEPTGDDNTVYSFHWYDPKPFHMQKRPWLTDKNTYHYPGEAYGREWDRARIERTWYPALQFAKEHKVKLFCGEFGCVSDCPEMEDMLWLLDVISLFDQNDIGWTYYHYMFRTIEPYWTTQGHFDCNLFIYDLPNRRLRTFDRKVSLMSDLFRLRGKVLRHAQPNDPDLMVYAVLTPEGMLRVYVSNKSREHAKSLAVSVAGGPWSRNVAVKRMARGTQGYVTAPAVAISGGEVALELEPLTILRLTIRPRNSF